MYFLAIAIYELLQVHSAELVSGSGVFNGVSCATPNQVLVIDTLFGVSLGHCKQTCFELKACLYIKYIRPFHACQLLAKGDGLQNQLVITGSCASYRVNRTIGQFCTRNSNCVEKHSVCLHANKAYGGLCFCDKFYRYVSTRLECVQVCDHLLDVFEEHIHMGFFGYNSLGIEITTLEECKHKCVINEECMSFEFRRKEKWARCHMGRASMEMMLDADPAAIRPYLGWDIYSRQCGNISAS